MNGDTPRPNVPLTPYELELFAYHVGCIYRDSGSFGLSCRDGILAEVWIEQQGNRVDVWDSVTMNGHSVGNRAGGAMAYSRMVAGDPEWWRAR